MTEQQEHIRFKHLFWFAVGVVTFCMAFSVYIVYIDKSQIASLTTFWLSTGAAGCIGFIVGSSVTKTKASDTKGESNITTGENTQIEINKAEPSTTPSVEEEPKGEVKTKLKKE